jgi:hypothetical protein
LAEIGCSFDGDCVGKTRKTAPVLTPFRRFLSRRKKQRGSVMILRRFGACAGDRATLSFQGRADLQ